MITEIAIVGIAIGTYKYIKNTNIRQYKNNFKDIMESIGIKNKKEETFEIDKLESTDYGYRGIIKIPNGLSMEILESKMSILEDNLNGFVVLDKKRFTPNIDFRAVNKDIDKYIYEPVKCKPHELYLGKLFTTDDYKVDLNKDSQIIIAGATGTGKTMLLSTILTNLIYNSQNYIELYLLQITKSELSSFESCRCVKGVAYNIEDTITLLDNILNDINKRSDLFKEQGIRNITQWNKHNTKNKINRKIIVVEELSFYIEEEEVVEKLTSIAKVGRSLGIHLIGVVQRSTANNIPPNLKSQMSRITFRQKSSIDSINIINDTSATKLGMRECIFDGNGDFATIKTPYIDDDFTILHKYVSEIRTPSKENTNIIKTNNVEEDNIFINEDIGQITMLERHGLIEAKIVEDNIEPKNIKAPKKDKSNKNHGVISWEEYKNVKGKR